MSHHTFNEVTVSLATADGVHFAGLAQSVALGTQEGTIDITARGESFLDLRGTSQFTVRTREGTRIFEISNANGSIKATRLSVLAHSIREIPALGPAAPPEPITVLKS